METDDLPLFLGGQCASCPNRECLGKNVGPWNPEGKPLYPGDAI